MTDGQGRTVDFKNTVIIMTSNLGSQEIMNRQGEDPEVVKEAVMDEVKKHFRPEFINRIDEIVVFNALDQKAIREIARIQIRKLAKRMEQQNIGLDVTEAALDEIGKVGFDPLFGARPLRRAVKTIWRTRLRWISLRVNTLRETRCLWTMLTENSFLKTVKTIDKIV